MSKMIDKKFLKSITVLYAEDDLLVRREISEVFSKLFKNLYVACDGKEALEIYQKEKNNIDIIISDINMPKINGFEFLEEVKKENKEIPFIFITAHSQKDYMINALRTGIDDYFIKPIDIFALISKVEILIKKNQNKKKGIFTKEVDEYLDSINKVALVYIFDESGKIKYINDFFKEVSKFEVNEIIGKTSKEILSADMPKNILDVQFENLLKDEKWSGKLKFKSKDGELFYTNCTIMPVKDLTSKKSFISVNFLTTKEENSRKEFKRKVLYDLSETKKIYTKAQEKIDVLMVELQKYKAYEDKDISLEKLKNMNQNYLEKIEELENKLRTISQKHDLFVKDINYKIKQVTKSTVEMKEYILKSTKKIVDIKREIKIREEFIEKIRVEIDNRQKRIDDLTDVLKHRNDQVQDSYEDFGLDDLLVKDEKEFA